MNTQQVCLQIADAGLLGEEITWSIKNREDFDLNEVVSRSCISARDIEYS